MSDSAAHTAPRIEVAWTPELRRLEREYDEAKHAAYAAYDGFEEGLSLVASEAWERFSAAVRAERERLEVEFRV
jgi:hypothetical protein